MSPPTNGTHKIKDMAAIPLLTYSEKTFKGPLVTQICIKGLLHR